MPSTELVKREMFINPGYVCLPAEPAKLCAVVSSGVAVTIHDGKRRMGGMCHYAKPRRENGQSTAVYAAPSIVALVRLFTEGGSNCADLEAYLYGGSFNKDADGYIADLHEENARAGMELLKQLNVRIAGADVGGNRGRKIVFCTDTGEVAVAKVDRIRSADWYPAA